VRQRGALIEVATFRGLFDSEDDESQHASGRILRDNVFGTVEEDALRRDFTINALFLDPVNGEIRDYVGGYRDLAERRLRLIGDPEVRYREDPVRLLRAARFVAKLGVEPDEDTGRWIPELAHLLEDVPPARLFEETCKLFMTGHGMRSMEALQRFGLSATLFPGLPKGAGPGKMQLGGVLRHSLENTDERVRTEKPVTPAFLYAALLWSEVEQRASHYASQGDPEYVAMMRAAEEAIGEQVRRTAIPRRFSAVTRQIWLLQTRFNKTRGKRWKRLLYEERFRAGYDFLLLRAREDPSLEPLCEFWTKAQQTVEAPSAADRASAKRRDRPGRRYRRRAPSAG
jgi:poly(A) polymerase